MKLLYFANIRLPTERAHGVQIMKTCEALARAGVEVELVVPTRTNAISQDAFAYYGLPKTFAVTYLPSWDTALWGRLGFMLATLSFAWAAARYAARARHDCIYGRDEQVLARVRTDAPILWETHTGAWNTAAQRVAARARCIVAISQGLKDFYVERGVPAEKLVVAHDGVDLGQFDPPLTRVEARVRLGLAPSKPLVVYTGSQYARKGVATLRAAATLLPEAEVLVVSDKPHQDIPLYLRAADVLVLPNSGADLISARYTSPMKLFEYMASGTPLVASDVPSVREVLDDSLATLVASDDPPALAAGIRRALNDPESAARAARARAKVAAQYTWDARARSILSAL